jgi:methyl-accepting chemotaxis protein
MSVSERMNAAAAEILASTQQQATGTKEQAATIQQITATMEEVRQSGVQISERAKQVTATAEATATITVTGLSTVQEANQTMEAIRQQVEEVAENVVSLSEKTQAVGEIIATVNDIAERSNLLALNAAIEAAAAGDQGSRFSVVANEIKNLADQAKESTVQVRTILGDIQKRINSSVMLTEEAVKRTETGKQQADVTEDTIRRMADTTQESVQAFQQIISATCQQQIGFEQVTQGMQDIGQAASQTAAGTVQLEKAVASLNAQSHQLREAVGRYQI